MTTTEQALAEADRLLTAYERLEDQDRLDDAQIAPLIHAWLAHRRNDAQPTPSFEALPTGRQSAYLYAARIALRLMSPAWVATAKSIADEEPNSRTAITTFLHVLQGLHPLSTRHTLQLMQMLEDQAAPPQPSWHRVVGADDTGAARVICPQCWPASQRRWVGTPRHRDLTITRLAPREVPTEARCHTCEETRHEYGRHTTRARAGLGVGGHRDDPRRDRHSNPDRETVSAQREAIHGGRARYGDVG